MSRAASRTPKGAVKCRGCRKPFVPSRGEGLTCSDCRSKAASHERALRSIDEQNTPEVRSIRPGDNIRCDACEQTGVVWKTPTDASLAAMELAFNTQARIRAWHWQRSEACHDDMGISRVRKVEVGAP